MKSSWKVIILNGMVWKDPTKVTFEQKLEENEEANHADFWGLSSRKRELPCKSLKRDPVWQILGTERRPVCRQGEWQ